MSQITELRLPPSPWLHRSKGQSQEPVSFPFEAQETIFMMSEYFLIGLYAFAVGSLVIVLFLVSNARLDRGVDWINLLVAIPMAVFGVQRLRACWHRYRFGLAKITVSTEGLFIPLMFDEVLPWTETKGVALNGYEHSACISITSVLVTLKQESLFKVRAGNAKYFKINNNCITINLRGFSYHNELAEAILCAANKYSGTYSPWTGSPNAPYST